MLIELLPKSHNHHRSLPIFGSVLDDFDDWLVAQGYRFSTRQCYILRCTAIERYFHRRKIARRRMRNETDDGSVRWRPHREMR